MRELSLTALPQSQNNPTNYRDCEKTLEDALEL